MALAVLSSIHHEVNADGLPEDCQRAQPGMEDVDLGSWISEWHVVVGLVIYLSWFWFCACIFIPMQMCIGRLCYGSRHHFEQDHLRRERTGFIVLLMCAGRFLMIYGTLKHSPALAVLVIMVQSLFTSFFDAFRGLLDPNQSLRKMKKREEQYLKDTQKDAPKRRSINSTESEMQGNEKSKVLEPVSAYSDFEGCGLLECTLVFAVQMMLYAVLIASVFTRERFTPAEATDQEEMKFVGGAVIATLMAARGESFHKNELIPFWNDYFRKGYRKDRHWARVRVFMSWLVNAVFARTMVLMLPIILMDSEDGVEFVKDATSVMFIAELDVVSQSIFRKPLLPEIEVPKNDLHGVLPNVNETNDADEKDTGTTSENQSGDGEGDPALLAPLPGELPLPDSHVPDIPDATCEEELHDNTPILE